jgi:hypothetical protein
MNGENQPMAIPQMDQLIQKLREETALISEFKEAIALKIGKFNATTLIRVTPKPDQKEPPYAGACGELLKLISDLNNTRGDLEIIVKELSHIIG